MTKQEIVEEIDTKIREMENEADALEQRARDIQCMANTLRSERCAVEHDEKVNLATLRINGARDLSLRVPHRFAHDPYAK